MNLAGIEQTPRKILAMLDLGMSLPVLRLLILSLADLGIKVFHSYFCHTMQTNFSRCSMR